VSLVITEEVSIAELDEAINNMYTQLKTDVYGNRMEKEIQKTKNGKEQKEHGGNKTDS
jgi:hypothetical protein